MKSLILTERKTHQQVSDLLTQRNPGIQGLTINCVSKFCVNNGIREKRILAEAQMQNGVSECDVMV